MTSLRAWWRARRARQKAALLLLPVAVVAVVFAVVLEQRSAPSVAERPAAEVRPEEPDLSRGLVVFDGCSLVDDAGVAPEDGMPARVMALLPAGLDMKNLGVGGQTTQMMAASAAIICVVCPPTPRFFMSRPAGSSAMTRAGMPSSGATPASSTREQPSKTTSPRLRSGSSSRTSAAGRSATERALRCSSTTAKTTATTATGNRSSAAFCQARLARHQALEDVIVEYYRQTAGEASPRDRRSARPPAALLDALALGDVRDERHLASALDGRGELALVAPAGAGDARRLDLASVADEAAQRGEVLVIDLVDLLFAEVAETPAGGVERTALLLVGSRPGFGARHALFLSRPLPRVGAACDSQGRACRDNGRGASPRCRLSEEKGRAADAASPPNRTRPPRTCVPAQRNPSPCRNSAGTQTCAGRPAEGRISRARPDPESAPRNAPGTRANR